MNNAKLKIIWLTLDKTGAVKISNVCTICTSEESHVQYLESTQYTCDYCRNSIISWLNHTRISVANYEHLLCCNSLLSFCSKFKDHWKMMDPHDPGISKNKPFKKGEQNFYLAVVLCRATSLSLLLNWQLLSCCVSTCSLSRNCWDTLLSSCLPMLVCKIWWVTCDKQHWDDKEMSQSKKKTELGGSVPAIFVWDCSYWLP